MKPVDRTSKALPLTLLAGILLIVLGIAVMNTGWFTGAEKAVETGLVK